MSNPKHTPGPWVVHENGLAGLRHYSVKAGTVTVADHLHENHAALIAAAPEMLATIKRISYGLTLPETDTERAIRKVLDELIAKAEGLES